MTVGGRQVSRGSLGSFAVRCPATGDVVALAPNGGAAELDAAVAAARAAFPAWSARPWAERQAALRQCAAALSAEKGALAALLTAEQGKGQPQALGEVLGSAAWLQLAASHGSPDRVLRDELKDKVELTYKPLGVAGCITAWNFPVILLHFKVAQALLSGCTVVIKPSEYTPLTALELGRIYSSVLPPGVLNVVCSEDKALGRLMVEHAGIDKISFTGSTETGRRVMAQCGQQLKRCTVELGGNDAAVVLGDVDPKQVAPYLFRAAFGNSGQVCMAVKRILAHESIAQPLAEALAEEARKPHNRFGNGADKGVVYGPVQNGMQYQKVRELLVDAVQRGATMLCGSVPPPLGESKGFLFHPVVLTGATEGWRIVDEEQFGPVVPVMPFATNDEAVRRANATPYGLGASVWTNDLATGRSLAAQIDAGTVWVNDHGNIIDDVPFGGAKTSGIGHEGGEQGLLAFMQLHVLKTKKGAKL
jgi:acyl-CoA reductase-like NAD-dependent aldehyde dehydrogenase